MLASALALAQVIAANAPLVVQASKRIAAGIGGGAIPSERDAWRRNSVEIAAIIASADSREGPRALAEKRAPCWQAR